MIKIATANHRQRLLPVALEKDFLKSSKRSFVLPNFAQELRSDFAIGQLQTCEACEDTAVSDTKSRSDGRVTARPMPSEFPTNQNGFTMSRIPRLLTKWVMKNTMSRLEA
jgi:hypothetical protein